MSLAETIADALGGKKKTADGFICKCPCHDDNSASLSVTTSEKGGVVLNCFAGCNWETVRKELQSRGLLNMPSNGFPAKVHYPDRYSGAKFYIYKDLVGNILCRKVKMPDKKMWFERFESGSYKPGLAGMSVPLYNLQSVVDSPLVYLCEGEKDSETLISRGLIATTNHAGAKSWAPILTEQLKNKTVIIIPDNDDAGRKRVAIVSKALQGHVKELRVFVPDGVSEHGDITDWVNNSGDVNQILPRSIVIEKKAGTKKATHDQYYDLFDKVLGDPKRCIFNEKLMTFDPTSEIWNPAINSLDRLRASALIANETSETKFNSSFIQPFFFAYEATKPLEFLVDVPEWDGQDRISAMAHLMKLKDSAGISAEAFSDLLKEWCALVFQRLEDPMIQNRILVLQGGQGIGKDTWTSMLVDGLGQFSIPFSVVKEDKDTYLNLHRGLIMKISEFDKTAKTEISTLKDIITAPSTNLRAPYDKDSKLRYSRCSFISSANIQDILRDYTGNRRFLIFEIESIEYAYEGWSKDKIRDWQMQSLAEMKELARCKYKASVESWRLMREYIERQTPTDPALYVKESFIMKCKKELMLNRDEVDVLITDSGVNEIIMQIARETGYKVRSIASMLKNQMGVYKRVGTNRYWSLRLPSIANTPELTLFGENQGGLPF